MSITIHATKGNLTTAKRAIKAAAKAGGEFTIVTDSRPPRGFEADKLVMMARGARLRDIENWKSEVARIRSKGTQWPCNGTGQMSRRYLEEAEWIEDRGPYTVYRPDPDYEARMAKWAEGVKEREAARDVALRAQY